MGRISVYAVCACYCCHCKWNISTQGTWILAAMPSAVRRVEYLILIHGFLESNWNKLNHYGLDCICVRHGETGLGLSIWIQKFPSCLCMALVWLPHTLASPRGFVHHVCLLQEWVCCSFVLFRFDFVSFLTSAGDGGVTVICPSAKAERPV